MKKTKIMVACMLLSGSVLFSSCIGSFGLWNNLKDWNSGVSNKFVNELVFVAFHIIPVYEIAYLADVLVVNSIEFWSGSNPVTADRIGEVKEVKGENGTYLVTTKANGYTISKEGEDNELALVFNEENNTWSASANGESYELIQMNEDGTMTVNLQDGNKITVTPDMQGVSTAKVASENPMAFVAY